MKYQALTLKAPGIARSILIPLVASQSKILCEKFSIEKIEADVLALIDTGATNTSISKRLAESLALKVIEQCEVGAAGGVHIANVYLIDVLLRNMVEFTNIRSAEFMTNEKFDIIIGMDILTKGDLAITNHDNRTVLSFRVPPDTSHIDFVEAGKRESNL
ncbi:MAG: retroviral-like aspartic protease family protein [Treponema sp.]|nr:retroviral-like aspartic protease family protein [Treponema sp.]